MAGQFLLNPDGTWPNGMTAERCAVLDLIPVLPSAVPVQPGYVAVEADPVQDGDLWRQVWVLQPVPEHEPEPEAVPVAADPLVEAVRTLTNEQKAALLEALTL